jgi:hypothetical protein
VEYFIEVKELTSEISYNFQAPLSAEEEKE